MVSSALTALARLQEGNRHFVTATSVGNPLPLEALRADLAEGQNPFAIVLGCSDSRVSPEVVFCQGLGDLFVIRVAGNIVAPSLIASIEFAAEQFGTRLVVVLGHSRCGAVLATLQELSEPNLNPQSNLRSITGFIRPSVAALLDKNPGGASDPTLVREAVRMNVRASAQHLRHGSSVLEQLIREDGLLVLGAEYSLDTGVVDFFDGIPE